MRQARGISTAYPQVNGLKQLKGTEMNAPSIEEKVTEATALYLWWVLRNDCNTSRALLEAHGIDATNWTSDFAPFLAACARKLEAKATRDNPKEDKMNFYRKKALQPMRPYVLGESMRYITVSEGHTPALGDMVAVAPDGAAGQGEDGHPDMWIIPAVFFKENYEWVSYEVTTDEGDKGE
jgi:hypothetical protein